MKLSEQEFSEIRKRAEKAGDLSLPAITTGEFPEFKTTKEAMLYAQQNRIPNVLDAQTVEFVRASQADVGRLLAHIEAVEAERDFAKGMSVTRATSINDHARVIDKLRAQLAAVSEERDELRARANKVIRRMRDDQDKLGEAYEAATDVESFRSRLAAAVRHCSNHVDDEVMELIESFPLSEKEVD